MTSAGERPRLMKIMSGMPLISARSPETTRVRVSLRIISVQAAFGPQMELIMPHSIGTESYWHHFVVHDSSKDPVVPRWMDQLIFMVVLCNLSLDFFFF